MAGGVKIIDQALNVTGDSRLDGSLDVVGAITSDSIINRIPLWTKAEVLTDTTTPTTLTVAQTGTVFLIDDAALILLLPALSAETIGCRYKFIITDKESTAFTVKCNASDNSEYFAGYHVGVVSSAIAEHFVPDGNSNSEINFNGGTTGGKLTGETGNTVPLNTIEIEGIASSGQGWFAAVHTCSAVSEAQATVFDDQ